MLESPSRLERARCSIFHPVRRKPKVWFVVYFGDSQLFYSSSTLMRSRGSINHPVWRKRFDFSCIFGRPRDSFFLLFVETQRFHSSSRLERYRVFIIPPVWRQTEVHSSSSLERAIDSLRPPVYRTGIFPSVCYPFYVNQPHVMTYVMTGENDYKKW